jgi:hypothetical protein
MTGILANNPVEIQRELSGPELIQIEETTRSEKSEAPSPSVGSSEEALTQPKIARTSGRKSIPNHVFDSVTIYDDEEILKVSLVTSVQITEEKEPKKASTPGTNTPSHIHP